MIFHVSSVEMLGCWQQPKGHRTNNNNHNDRAATVVTETKTARILRLVTKEPKSNWVGGPKCPKCCNSAPLVCVAVDDFIIACS